MSPKIRAWDKEYEVMTDWFWLSSEGDLYEEPVTVYDTPHLEIERNDDLIVMQYTGLKDKNGVEIYVGDFVLNYKKVTRNKKTTMVEDYWEVYYKKEYGQFLLRSANKVRHLSFAAELEISGNIYENPELLKEQNK